MDRKPVLSSTTGVPLMIATAGAYLTMLQIFAESGRGRMWPSWYVGIPVGLFVVALVLTVLPLRKRPPDSTAGGPSPSQPPPAPPRTGIRMRGGTGRFPHARIRNMDTAVDTEGTDLDMEEPDIG